jgi:DNA-binding winged helix-turn-helix (wHTH) protein
MLFRRESTVPTERFRFGDFEFDVDSGEVRRHDAPGGDDVQRLPPQPARLLALLAARGGEVVGRNEIRDRLWPDVEVDFDTSLHFCVRQIRTALGDSATNPHYVENLPRRGYRLVPPVERVAVNGLARRHDRGTHRTWPWLVGLLVAAIALAGWLAPRHLVAPPGTPPRVGIMTFAPPEGTVVFGDPAPIADWVLEGLATGAGQRAHVVGPTTTAEYTDSDTSVRKLIADYDLDYLVNGRFVEGDDGPRMLAELIRVSDGAHVWVRPYEDLHDHRRIGSEIAERVLRELDLRD